LVNIIKGFDKIRIVFYYLKNMMVKLKYDLLRPTSFSLNGAGFVIGNIFYWVYGGDPVELLLAGAIGCY
jgi:hypothetical protein